MRFFSISTVCVPSPISTNLFHGAPVSLSKTPRASGVGLS
jgi:hypothetical protein